MSEGPESGREAFMIGNRNPRLVSCFVVILIAGLGFAVSAQTASAGKRVLWTATSPVGSTVGGMTLGDDYNGDGVRDFIVRQQSATASQLSTTSIDWVSGVDGTLLRSVITAGGSNLGFVIAPCDDFNLDGVRDVIVSNTPAPGAITAGPSSGTDFVVYSSATATPLYAAQLTAFATSIIAIASVDDINGDGFDEFFVTTMYPGGFLDRSLRLGIGGGLIWSATWGQESFPPIVCDDLDGDGVRDLLWGQPNVSAQGNISAGAIGAVSTVTGAPIYTVFGSRFLEGRIPVLAIPDDNGDGIGDFISNGYFPGLTHELQWHSGATGAVYRTVAATFLGSAIPWSAFRPAGDVDGDGVPDHAFFVGAIPGRTVFFDNFGNELLRIEDGPNESHLLVSDGADLDGDGSSEVVLSRFNLFSVTEDFAVVRTGPFLPAIAARTIVDPSTGNPIAPLLVNGQSGGRARRVDVPQGSVFSVAIFPTSTTPRPFILFGSLGFPSAATATGLPLGLGTMTIIPQPLAPTASGLFVLADSFTPGGAVLGGPLAPWSTNFGAPNLQVTVTLQGIILDPLSTSPVPLSLTNAVAIDVY